MLPNQEPSFPYVARLAFGLICITILVYWMYVQDAQEKVENKAEDVAEDIKEATQRNHRRD